MSSPALHKSLAVLNDLRVLSPASNDRLLDQLDFYLNNIPNEQLKNTTINAFSKIIHVLDNQIKLIIENFYKVRPEIKDLSIENKIEDNNLNARETLFDNIDLILRASEAIGMAGSLNFHFWGNSVSLTGLVNLEDISETKKVNIYKITRMFLKKKILFTYKIVKRDSKNSGLIIELLFDFSHVKDLLSSNGNFLVFNQLNKYEINFEKFYKLKNHLCLEITDEMHLIRYKAISDAVKLSKSQKIIVHFPFLFRHISLIIPSREESNEAIHFDFFSIFND